MHASIRVRLTTSTPRAARWLRAPVAVTRMTGIAVLSVAASALVSCTGSPRSGELPAPQEHPPIAVTVPLPIIQLAPGIVVDRTAGEVRVEAEVAADRGWLEQAVCKAGTREHESLLAVIVAPSSIHAALLLIGLEPGAPGEWRAAPDGSGAVQRISPSGSPLELWVRTSAGDMPLSSWIHDPVHGHLFPVQPWVFAGSRIRSNTKSMGPGVHYVADRTGSVVGIVTFGDETIACTSVLSDQAELDAPEWQANSERMPEPGTRVELLIRRTGYVASTTGMQPTTATPPVNGTPSATPVIPAGSAP